MNIFYNFDLNNEPAEFMFDLNVPIDLNDLHMNSDEELFYDNSNNENQGEDENPNTGNPFQVYNQRDFNLNETPPCEEETTLIRKRKFLSNEQREAVYLALLEKSVNGKLGRETTKNVASAFSVSIRVIQRIWKRAKTTASVNGKVDVSHRKTKNCGRKRVTIDMEQFRNIPLCKRTTLRSLAFAIKIGKTTLLRQKELGIIRRHYNAIKPLLKEGNKRARVEFCISMLDPQSVPRNPRFVDMYNVIHVDEKWFYMTKKKENYYLLSNEDEPHRTCKSKNFVDKVMFLAAVARPRFDNEGNMTFSGKLGIFPFVTREPAKRSSVNRPAGTLETKAMTSIGREVIRSFYINKVLKAIREKWPREDRGKTICIQQDNARTHIEPDDPEFCQAAAQEEFNIYVRCQPPNSPDLNVLDLGFFNAIQSLRYKEAPKNIDELVIAVEKAFEEFSPSSSNKIFLTLQQVMVEIMKVRGSNAYKIPHMNKARLQRQGGLPCQIRCDNQLVSSVKDWLNRI